MTSLISAIDNSPITVTDTVVSLESDSLDGSIPCKIDS